MCLVRLYSSSIFRLFHRWTFMFTKGAHNFCLLIPEKHAPQPTTSRYFFSLLITVCSGEAWQAQSMPSQTKSVVALLALPATTMAKSDYPWWFWRAKVDANPPSTSQDLRISTENNANEAALEEFRHFRPPLTPNLVVFDRPHCKAKDTGFPWLAYYVRVHARATLPKL